MKALKVSSIAVALISVSVAQASVSLVTTRGDLAGNDYIDWSTISFDFGPVFNGSNVSTNNGMTVNVSQEQAVTLQRRVQGSSWNGNFATGDGLLWTQGPWGPMDFVFDSAIRGAGAQIQSDFYGSFLATISAYDASNNLLGSFNLAGNSTHFSDNSAIFIGIESTSQNIKRVRFGVFHPSSSENFAINQLDLRYGDAGGGGGGGGSAIPGPAAAVPMLLGLANMLRKRRAC
jgi:hypothetical protein